jgi:hypothetical protein
MDRSSTNLCWMVGCRVTAKSEERGRIFVRAAFAMLFE